MHGARAYCNRYGHDWKIEEMFSDPEDDTIVWEVLHCLRCDAHAVYARFEDGE